MNDNLSGSAMTSGAFCPACERFIGAADVCPYCDADSAKPPFLRVFRRASLLLAVGGLIFLYLMSVGKETPAVRISEITPLMNFARVQITGTVQKMPFIGTRTNKTDYISFLVDDGSGQLRVKARGDIARRLEEKGLIPKKDEIVEVAGVIEARAGATCTLQIRSPNDIRRKGVE